MKAGAVQDHRFIRLLKSIPDTPETRRQVWLNDFRYMWRFLEERGIARPDKDDPPDAILEVMRTLVGQESSLELAELFPWAENAPWIAGGVGTNYPGEYLFYAASGIDARNVELTGKTGPGEDQRGLSKGPEELAVVLGDYSRDEILSKLKSCGECIPGETRAHAGIEYLSWGEDFGSVLRNRLKPPWFDTLGRAVRVAMFYGKIVQARSTQGVEDLIDVHDGQRPSLGEDPAIATAVSVLESLGAYAGVVSAADFSLDGLHDHLARRCVGQKGYASSDAALYVRCPFSPAGSEAAAAEAPASDVVRTAPLLKPFEVAAFGLVPKRDPMIRQVVVVLVHADHDAASRNVDLLLKRLEDTKLPDGSALYSGRLKKAELQVDGPVLIARITIGPRFGMEYLTPEGLIDLPLTVHE